MGKSWPLSGMLSHAFLEPGRASPQARPQAVRRLPSLGSASVTRHAEGLGVWSGGGSGAAATPRPGLIRSGAARLTVGPEPRAQSRGGEGGTGKHSRHSARLANEGRTLGASDQ